MFSGTCYHRGMRILVTNDDGIDSEGLYCLARELSGYADVTVVAPDREYSGASASLGVLGQIQPEVHRARLDGLDDVWAVSGPPALCVMFALLGVFDHAFDLVVAGINPGVNVGRSIYHSGTVGAVLTARSRGVPGIAVSQAVEGYGIEGQGWDEMLKGVHWEAGATVAGVVAGALVQHGLRNPLLVNLNIPNLPVGEMAGWQRTSIGRIPPRVIADARLEERVGHPGAFKVVMEWGDAVSLPEGSDGGAVERDRVSLTLLSHLSATDAPVDTSAEEAAYPAIAAALDSLFAPG